eukprot:Gregarina_sp_Pseudo_9__5563@NODE_745_length_2281_cov_84_090544_g701_i0_p2_GENE_NODE_745_length_2281_cov_84_090544_g701_i0NODE_745_length_2281_cov_84_090544_g701_i0_p2_ORF_typecomplete_len242_score34_06Proteasome/PF00227_26/1_5e36_NODE_745_length_2281_cov_84_090544_g701_i0155880
MFASRLPAHPMHKFDDLASHGCSKSQPQPAECRWSPYVDNGGSVCAVAGKDFTVVAADTRTTLGYSIMSRNQPKWLKLTSTTILASGGMRADIQGLWNVMKWYVTEYTFAHKREPSTQALAQQLSNVLYSRRFFPFYTFNILAGLDDSGRGVLYSYDAVGSHEPVYYATQGSANEMIMPILDNAIGQETKPTDKPVTECVDLCYDSIKAATEREISTGDSCDVILITKEGIKVENKPLKKD